jgi:hypothetical protein
MTNKNKIQRWVIGSDDIREQYRPEEIRRRIAVDAALLVFRRKEQSLASARKRAARSFKQSKLTKEFLPSTAEIQIELEALAGVFAAERDPARLRQVLHELEQLERLLSGLPYCFACQESLGKGAAGTRLEIEVLKANWLEFANGARAKGAMISFEGTSAVIHGGQTKFMIESPQVAFGEVVETYGAEAIPVEVAIARLAVIVANEGPVDWDSDEFATADYEPGEHPERWDLFEVLLTPLELVRLPKETHPEGDALYHSLQVLELGKNKLPYDEEFLLACLLHDVGLAIDPRQPMLSGIDALGDLITARTRTLLQLLEPAHEYLRTGQATAALRRSPDFEEAVLLARCDRDGRVCGAEVPSLEEALSELAAIEGEWDEVE